MKTATGGQAGNKKSRSRTGKVLWQTETIRKTIRRNNKKIER